MVDAQSGHEKTITGILPALAGANVIYGLGMLEMGITFDLAQLVLDNEIAEMIKYAVNGIPVNDETLAVDIIKEMGIGKDYLAHESTYQHMASQSRAELMDRRMREDWEADGSKAKGSADGVTSDEIWLWDQDGDEYQKNWLFDSAGAYPVYDGVWMDSEMAMPTGDVLGRGRGWWFISYPDVARTGAPSWTWYEPVPY